jgi:hypothetical protein
VTTTPARCPHCPDGHTPPDGGSQPWSAWVGTERDGDGQPMTIHVARSAGAHLGVVGLVGGRVEALADPLGVGLGDVRAAAFDEAEQALRSRARHTEDGCEFCTGIDYAADMVRDLAAAARPDNTGEPQ